MFNHAQFPILEFDTDTNAKINPSACAQESFGTDKLVITFFPEVIEKMLARGEIVSIP